jgi:hypothetical protein
VRVDQHGALVRALAALLVADYRRTQKNETAAPGRVTAVIHTDEGTVDAHDQRSTT